jgi:TetR/AcrR family transcriptional regulator
MARQKLALNLTKQRKQQIMSAALEVFQKKGYAGATIPDIADAAQVSVGTIYNYYESKHDLLVALVGSYLMSEKLAVMIQRGPTSSDSELLSSLMESRLAMSPNTTNNLLALINEIHRDPELRAKYMEKVLGPALRLIKKYLDEKVEEGVFRPVDTSILARAIAGMAFGLTVLTKLEGEKSPFRSASKGEAAAEITNMLLDGLRKKSECGPS